MIVQQLFTGLFMVRTKYKLSGFNCPIWFLKSLANYWSLCHFKKNFVTKPYLAGLLYQLLWVQHAFICTIPLPKSPKIHCNIFQCMQSTPKCILFLIPNQRWRSAARQGWYTAITKYHTPMTEYCTRMTEYCKLMAKYCTPMKEYRTPMTEYRTPMKEYCTPKTAYIMLPQWQCLCLRPWKTHSGSRLVSEQF